jgi:small-conductance mechanosensitive channel
LAFSTALLAVALGFVAAWSILSNATSAVLVLILRPFRIGDTVELMDP